MATKQIEAFVTPKFRAAFVWAFRGKPPQADSANKKPRYTVLMLFPKGTDLSQLISGKAEAEAALWEGKAKAISAMPSYKSPIKDALAIVNSDGEPYFPWAKDWKAIEAWSYTAPGIAGPKLDPSTGKVEILTVDTDFYSGAWARAKVRPYSYDGRKDQKGFGTNFELVNIQKLADDEKFGAVRTKAEDDFEAIDAADDDMMNAG